jgi:site-specific DNA-methyltransferase (adenine-specific)
MKKYQIIVVDPPWQVKKLTRKARPNQTKMDYKTMSLAEIAKLPIQKLADNRCFCFLWTTQKYLFDAKTILTHWGFTHLLTMVWEKTYGISAGMPLFGFRWNGEFVLVGTVGKRDLWPKRPLIPAVFSAENIRHSQKPDRFYKMIEPLGDNRIDLFARQKRDGWDVWGNEVKSDIEFGQTIKQRIKDLKKM